jgi:hypothetical protein
MYNGVNIYMCILSPKQCTMVYIYVCILSVNALLLYINIFNRKSSIVIWVYGYNQCLHDLSQDV